MSAAKGKGKNGKGPPSTSSGGSGGPGKDGREMKDGKLAIDADASDLGDGSHANEVRKLLDSTAFDVFIGVIIMMNAVSIGIEQTQSLNNQSTLGVRILESVFLVIYILELGLRFYGQGCACLRDGWVKLDLLLVVLGVLNSWVFEPALSGEKPDDMSTIMLLRTLRLMRIAKTARLLTRIPEFSMLLNGIMSSVTNMSCIFTVLLVVLYCFTSVGIELITNHSLTHRDLEFRAHADTYFASIPMTMLTLIQFVTLDDAATVYKPLCEKDPWLTIYFVALLLIVSILIVNLVAAVTISATFDSRHREAEAKQGMQERDRGAVIAHLEDIFSRLDEDKSGQLTFEAFLDMESKDQQALCQVLDIGTPQDIFKMLGSERTGEVSIDELFDCILDKALATGDVNLRRMERQIETMHWQLKESLAAQKKLSVAMKRMTVDVGKMWHSMHGDGEAAASEEPARKSSKGARGSGDSTNNRQATTTSCAGWSRQSIQSVAHPDGVRSAGFKGATVVEPQCKDPEMASWETEMAEKVRRLVDEGLHFAFERLRKVADAAKEDAGLANQSRRGDAQAKSAPKAAAARKSPRPTAMASPRSKEDGNTEVRQLPIEQMRGVPNSPHSSKVRPEDASISRPPQGRDPHQEQL